MSINCYSGLQGSGKSIEVVSTVILDAVLQGRRVVTNVSGIDEDKIHEYLVNKRHADPEKLGSIVHVTDERVMLPQFFPDEKNPELESVVLGGDLVAIDEAWRFWGTDNGKLSHEHMQFFRMHRHYVHAVTNVSCDVALMTQDVTGLHRSLKNVIELALMMQKHKSLGFSKRYRVDVHDGWKINSKTRIAQYQKRYNPEIFPLYQSYAGGQGVESTMDKRQNILANRTLWVYGVGVVVLALISGFSTWRFFHPPGTDKLLAQKSGSSSAQAGCASGSSSAHGCLGADATAVTKVGLPPFSGIWHVVGEYQNGSARWVVVAGQDGRLRVESPSVFSSSGVVIVGDIDGSRVARWTGQIQRGPMIQPSEILPK
jgi:zona occludens toxin